ncbi:MAG: hypothetical protein ACKO1J_04475 [Tagaea sp.]
MEYGILFYETPENTAERDDPAKAPAYWGAWSAYIQPAFPRWPHQFVTKSAIYDIRFNTLQVIGVAGHGAGDG